VLELRRKSGCAEKIPSASSGSPSQKGVQKRKKGSGLSGPGNPVGSAGENDHVTAKKGRCMEEGKVTLIGRDKERL